MSSYDLDKMRPMWMSSWTFESAKFCTHCTSRLSLLTEFFHTGPCRELENWIFGLYCTLALPTVIIAEFGWNVCQTDLIRKFVKVLGLD